MKISALLLSAVCCISSVAAQQVVESKTPNEKHSAQSDSASMYSTEFLRLAESWRLAYNSGDAKNLVSMYTEEAEYISAHVAGYVAHGRDAVIANFQKGMDAGGHIDAIDILSINSSCDLATLVCHYRGTNAGQKVDGRNLLVSENIKGKWLIVTHVTVIRD